MLNFSARCRVFVFKFKHKSPLFTGDAKHIKLTNQRLPLDQRFPRIAARF